MANQNHTPGPWISRRGTIGTVKYHIAEMMPSSYPDMPPGFAPADEQEANARLIAAAPELLEALLNLLPLAESAMKECGQYDIRAELHEARAAIAKATK
jgi:hypothetical protein